MAGWLLRNDIIKTPRVEVAIRRVPRHLFVPDVSLDKGYGHDSVITSRDKAGITISSASGPGVVAQMLEQLTVQPGDRILEIGAGTGYNAALLADLAGPDGQVTTLDVDEDIVADARHHLDSAGYGQVTVVHGDGTAGYPGNAPYDRVIVTCGAWDLPPAWRDQMTADARLVVPLRMRRFTRSIAFDRDGDVLRGQDMSECGFMPMRGPGLMPERTITIRAGEHPVVILRIDDNTPVDEDALSTALSSEPVVTWTGVIVPLAPFTQMDFWLGDVENYCRVLLLDGARTRGLPAPAYDYGSMGVYRHGTFAYLTHRDTGTAGSTSGGAMQELGVVGCGPAGASLCEQMTSRLQAWSRALPSVTSLRVDAYPAGVVPGADGALMVISKHHAELHACISTA